jgi:prevent-host-death family protein
MPGPSATVCSTLTSRSIPQRELRNNIGKILREAEAGVEFTITVRGRPVARLGPADRPRTRQLDVDVEVVRAILAKTPVDERLSDDIRELRRREEPIDDPWQDR